MALSVFMVGMELKGVDTLLNGLKYKDVYYICGDLMKILIKLLFMGTCDGNTEDTILAFREDGTPITLLELKGYLEPENKKELADFVYYRLYGRYIKPFKELIDAKAALKAAVEAAKTEAETEAKKAPKLGFSIMANMCLLIETLQCFKEGIEDSKGRSKEMFIKFFTGNEIFNIDGENFFYHVRCGILHQGETKGGWKIKRLGEIYTEKSIDAEKFLYAMESILEGYIGDLTSSDLGGDPWDKCIIKLKSIRDNCTA